MKLVSIQDLKRNVSGYLEAAEKGEHIIVTRHRRPIASIEPVGDEHVHAGDLVGRAWPKPLFRRATRGKYLDVLLDDRRGGPDR